MSTIEDDDADEGLDPTTLGVGALGEVAQDAAPTLADHPPPDFTCPVHQRLFDSSGRVVESDRLAQFLYIMARDEVPLGKLTEAFVQTMQPEADRGIEWADAMLAQFPLMFVPPTRLVDEPNPLHTLFLANLCTGLRRIECDGVPAPILSALRSTPEANDVYGLISNGWLMQYCLYIVRTLQSG